MSRVAIEIPELEQMLEAQIEALVRELLPNGRKDGHEWRVGSLAGERGQSMGVHLSGARAGWWKDFSGGDGGDALKLVAAVLFRGDLGKAVSWAISWLRLDDADPARIRQHRLEAKAAQERNAVQAIADAERAAKSARKRWYEGKPIADTAVEVYLATRGINLRTLGKAPGSLRYHPELAYGWDPEARRPIATAPAMVASVNTLDGRQIATHRTWLKPDGSGKADAADGITGKPKKVLGGFEGGHIALWKGACGRMPLRDIPAGTDVYVSEGIEDGLTAACADPSLRVICMVALGNLGGLQLPEQIGSLVVLAQNDAAGSKAEQSLGRGVSAQRARGVRVEIVRPPAGVKDLNDMVRAA